MSEQQAKERLRIKIQKLRADTSPAFQEKSSLNCCNTFFKNIELDENSVVSGYHPTNKETSPLLLIEELNKKNISTCLPVIKEKNSPLDFQEWKIGDKLNISPFFKISEPESKSVRPNIIVTPLVAFDKNMNRLGYGGGYYDRTLRKLKQEGYSFISIGYAYSFQEVEEVPTNEKDIPLDYVITEEKIYKKPNI